MGHGGFREGAGRKTGKPGVSEEVRQQILSEYMAGVPTARIAARHGVAKSYPTILAGRRGVERRVSDESLKQMGTFRDPLPIEPTKKPVQTVDAAEIKRLAARGMGFTQIAAALRCPYRHIELALR